MSRGVDEPPTSLEPLARIYLALSRINRTIERADSEIELLQSACATVVDVGGFRMAWAGVIDRETGEVRPVATAGHDDGYIASLRIRLEGPESNGPTAAAIRGDRTEVCRDIASDPRMAPWREAALARGFRSSAALPLHREGTVFGVLGVYASEPRGFGSGEVDLLEELARDVSLGLEALEAAAERRRAAQVIEASEARFRTSLETLLDPFVLLRPVRGADGRIVDFVYDYANAAACAANQMRREDLVGSRLLDVLPEHERAGLLESYARVMETGEPLVLDDLDYVDVWGGRRMSRVFDIRANRAGEWLAYTWRDVTDRRRAERQRAQDLERRVRERTAQIETARERAFALARFSAAALDATSDEVAGSLLEAVSGTTGVVGGLLLLGARSAAGEAPLFRIAAARGGRGEREETGAGVTVAEAALRRIEAGEPFVVGPDATLLDGAGSERAGFGTADPGASGLDGAAMATAAGRRLVVPLRRAGASTGALILQFAKDHEPDQDEVAFVVSMANAGAHALERLRIARAEREARGMLDAVVAQMPVGVTVVGRSGEVLYRNAADLATFRGRRGPGAGVPEAPRRGPDGGPNAAGPPGDGDRDAPSELDESPARATPADEAEPEARAIDGTPYGPMDWPVVRSLATGEPIVNEEIALRRRDGTSAIVMQTSAPVRDRSGQLLGAVVVSLDITERRSAEQLREAFVGVLSHELRTPVTTIYGGAKMLQTRGAHLPASVHDEILSDIAGESERLGRLVEDLLVLARAERGVDLTVNGAALLQHRLRTVLAALTAEWPDRHFVAEIPEHVPPVTGDEGYLEQVLRNLIGNAAKYGRREVLVRIETTDDEVRASVLDDGPGVEPSELERVFELFVRGHATSSLPGAGIGLFVARRLVEAMGGRLWAENRPEGGAAFRFVLPQFVES